MKLSPKALLLLAPLAMAAHAEVTFTPMASYHFFDNDKLVPSVTPTVPMSEVEDEVGFALALGYRFTPAFGLEAHYGRTRTELDTVAAAPTVLDRRIGLDGYYAFNAEGRVSPYVLLGAGQQSFKVTGTAGAAPADDGTYGNAALGAFFRFNDYVALRTEARDVYNFGSENNDILALVGLEFSGANAAAVVDEPAPAPEPAPVVEDEPAPAPAPVVPAAPADSDGDGVADNKDKCPNTPAGVSVDANGCPVDSDKDGVPDYLDQCPDTAANVVVDEKGCAKTLTEKISKDINILFDTSKSVVKDEFKGDIEEVAKLAQQYPTAFIEIQGHTDSSGNANLNNRLSQARADAVKNVLINEYGIDAGRLTATGYGSSEPVADNATAEGRAKNRRVVAVLSAEAKRVQVKGKK